MTLGYAHAQLHLIDRSRVFQGIFSHENFATWLVLHKTGGTPNLDALANWFATGPQVVSTHYGVGQDGTIYQFVDEIDGAGGNCCTETGHASFLPDADGKTVNLNLSTISIEHIDPSPDNSTPLTSQQQFASFVLIADICQRNGIPARPGDASGGIITHSQIAPQSRKNCPGNYPLDQLFSYLERVVDPMPNINQEKQASNTWSDAKMLLVSAATSLPFFPRTNTGIHDAWLAAYTQGHNFGPPVSYETQDIDWAGNSIIVQYFLYARCEWSNGKARWFDARGEIIVS